jgi:hypothetical protein
VTSTEKFRKPVSSGAGMFHAGWRTAVSASNPQRRIKSRDVCQACQGVRYFRAFVHKHQMLGVVDEVEGLVAYECSWSCEHSIDVFIHLASLLRLSSFPPPKFIHCSTQTESNVRVRFIIDCQEAVMTTRHTTKVHMLISA